MATISKLAPDSRDARKKLRPIRPNPFTPTLSIINPYLSEKLLSPHRDGRILSVAGFN
jgi:hypothetical protein